MKEIFTLHQTELFWTFFVFIIVILLRFITHKTIKRVGGVSNFVEARTLLIVKYASILYTFLGISVLALIWGVNYKDIALLFSSVFAIVGVALFAQWSIISNITSGVILFFSFPFKIGDKIKIFDKDILDDKIEENNNFIIEDIRAFHIHLRHKNGKLITYPNNLMLQKAVGVIDEKEVVE